MIQLTDAHRSVRTAPRNLRLEDGFLFAHEMERDIPAAHAMVVRNATLLGDHIPSMGNAARYHGLMHEELSGWRSWARFARLWIQRMPGLFRKADQVEKGLWITDDLSGSYFHWLTDALPRLFSARAHFPERPILLPESFSRVGYITASLELLGEKRIRYVGPGERLTVGELVITEQTAISGNYHDPLIRSVRDAFVPASMTAPHRKVFISRSKAPTRRILNDSEVNALMTAHGFEVRVMEELSFPEQVALMRETKVLAGTHGAGLTNMLLMPSGGAVLELRLAGDAHNNCYFALASALGQAYHYQVNTGSHALTQLADVTVDAEALAAALGAMDRS